MSENSNNFGRTALGIGAGTAAYLAGSKLSDKAMKPYTGKLVSRSFGNFNPEEMQAIRAAVEDSFVKSGLKAKGYKIQNINNAQKSESMIQTFVQRILTKYKKGTRTATRKINKITDKINIVYNGGNAFCSHGTKEIAVNLDKVPAVTFHEMGHGLNGSGKGIGKFLSRIRHPFAGVGVLAVLGIGLFKRKKAEGEEPNGFIDKTTTFIKENAGKLTFATMIPTLLEEGLASIRGGKLAKQAGLSKDILKKINIGNAKAWTTYLASALILSGLARLAINVRDKIAGPKQ